MQYTLPFHGENRLQAIHAILLKACGPVPPFRRLDPVSQLILAVLSGRTTDAVAMRVFVSLRCHLQGWEKLAGMKPFAVKKLIVKVNHSDKKAVELPECIRQIISRRGKLDLDFLQDWPVDYAYEWLESLTGVGPKTCTATLNFSTLRKRILMVDTAHNRVARRLALVPQKSDLQRTTRSLNRQLPNDWTATDTERHHILMQTLGKRVCTHSYPDCSNCPLRRLCPTPPKIGSAELYILPAGNIGLSPASRKLAA